MPSPDQSSVDLPIITFGGRVTQFNPQSLPIGASPSCQDVIFSGITPDGVGMVGGLATRPGMANFYPFAPFFGNPTINYLKTFVDSQGIFHLLSLDGGLVGAGSLFRDESPCPPSPNVPIAIGTVYVPTGSIAQSDSLLNREWIAISSVPHPSAGIDIPRQYDGVNFDRVSQVGPGAPPTVVDFSFALTAIARAAVTGVITATIGVSPAASGIVVGQLATVSGVTADPTLDGSYIVATVAGVGTTTFTMWSIAQAYQIQSITRSAGVVTAVLTNTPVTVPGATIVIGYVDDSSYDGSFIIATVSGNTVTWPQAGVDSVSFGGFLYTEVAAYPVIQSGVNNNATGPGGNYLIKGDVSLIFVAGSQISVVGNSSAPYNGVFQVFGSLLLTTGPYQGNTLVGAGPSTAAPGGTGGAASLPATASAPAVTGVAGTAGSILQGLHEVSCCFLTRQQYITKPAPFSKWFAAGGFKAIVNNIPFATNDPNVIGRILIFTPVIVPPALGGDFFYFAGAVTTPSAGTFPSMVINDVSTSRYLVDFSDADLQLATFATNLFNLLELGECSTVCTYSNRTFWAGERNKLPNLLNLTFDGGFTGQIPLGWTSDPVSGAGISPAIGYWDAGILLFGNSVNPIVGMIEQNAYVDSLGVPIIKAATSYSVRVRVEIQPPLTAGDLVIDLFSPTMGSFGAFTVPFASIATSFTWTEFIGVLTTGIATPPTDLLFRVYGAGTPSAGGGIKVDTIEPFPTLFPINFALVRASYVNDPESFDELTGFMQVGKNTGEAVRCMFTLLDNKLYIVTERGLYSTQDDGQNEPNLWAINTVSATTGTGSCRGVGIAEGWAVIVSHDGAYIFWGSEPIKITQEIQPDWDTINWNYDATIYCTIDTANKRIHIGVPTGAATSPNIEFVCDYSQLANAEGATAAQDIASHPQAYYSVYNPTKVVAPGKARKWTIWNLTMNCATLTIRSDGSYHLLRGNGTGTGLIYDQLPSQLSDDGVAISSQYQTAFIPQVEDEQALQLGSHRKLFKYLTGYANGAGVMRWNILGAQNQRGIVLSPLTLKNPEKWDFEMNSNFVGERASYQFGTDAVGAWFVLTKLCPTLQREIVTPVRGVT